MTTNENNKAEKKPGDENTTGIHSKLGPITDAAFENDATAEPREGLKPSAALLEHISKIGR